MTTNEQTKLARPAAIGTSVAIVAVLAVYALARSVDDPLAVSQGDAVAETIPVLGAIGATIIGGVIGAVLAAIARRTQQPQQTLLVAGGVGLLVSLAPPFQAAAQTSTALWLVAMHIVTAIAVLGAHHAALPHRVQPPAQNKPAARTEPTA